MPGAAGTTLVGGRYQLGALLGRGGMADVYAALDVKLQRPVAVKILRPGFAADDDLRSRFEREGRAAARLNHPRVVAVYDTGEDAGRPYLVMEQMPGETLADRMAAGRLDQAWLRQVAGQVLSALSAAHRAGILHRDVKPANVLLDHGEAKVADFGIAAMGEPTGADGSHDAWAARTAVGMVIGTPSYMAPERIEGQPATVQSDLYAVGVMLYEGLTGRKPFAGSTPLATAVAVQDGRYPPITELRPDADPRMVAAANRAMRPRPEDRYESALDMRSALLAPVMAPAMGTVPAAPGVDPPDATIIVPVPAGAGVDARDATVVLPVRRRHRLAATLVAAAVAAALAFTAFSLGPWNDQRASTTVTTTSLPPANTSTVPVVVAPATSADAPTTLTPTTRKKRRKGGGGGGNG
jgi:eukaryotic-like serine/threonine-protein kinase